VVEFDPASSIVRQSFLCRPLRLAQETLDHVKEKGAVAAINGAFFNFKVAPRSAT
jgi:hypothetical protein